MVGIGIFVKSLTGVLLTYEPQMVAESEKSVRFSSVEPGATRLTLEQLVVKAQEAVPGKTVGSISVKSDPSSSVLFGFGRGQKPVYLNAYTGEVLGSQSKMHDALHWIEDVHRWFGFRPVGKHISGVVTIGFFLLAVTGLYLWWPKKVTKFNKRLKGKSRDWNWHNVIGFWSLPVLIILSLTGIVIGYEWANNLVYRMTGNEPPPSMQRERREDQKPYTGTPALSAIFAQAEKQIPGWSGISLRYPQKDGGSFTATIEEDVSWGPKPRSQLTLDPATAEILKWEPFSDINTGRRVRVWIRYLHTGEAGGWFGQLIAGLASLGGLFLVWTGLALSYRRFFF